jgi:hypothetical protein
MTNTVTRTDNGEYLFNGESLRRHDGCSGGYRHIFVTSEGHILKLDYSTGPSDWNDWVYFQTRGEVAFAEVIAAEDRKFFPTVIDSGEYEFKGVKYAWILEECVEMETSGFSITEEFRGLVEKLCRVYRLSDWGLGQFGVHNVGQTEDGWPIIYDFGANPFTPYFER